MERGKGEGDGDKGYCQLLTHGEGGKRTHRGGGTRGRSIESETGVQQREESFMTGLGRSNPFGIIEQTVCKKLL